MIAEPALLLPGRFEAVVFDVDGLLVATEPAWEAAERALLARYGARYTDADRLATRGRSMDASIAVYAERIGLEPERAAALRAELLEALLAALPGVPPLPGAVSLVRSLAGRMPLAVASSSPRVVVDKAIAAVLLDGAFDVVVSGDDVERPKPAPDSYLLACRRLSVEPRRSIAFEDSRPGVAAATVAGLFCVAVQPDAAIDVSGADLIVPSLELVGVEPST